MLAQREHALAAFFCTYSGVALAESDLVRNLVLGHISYTSPISALYLPYISQVRNLVLGHISYTSPISPLYLPYISQVRNLVLGHIADDDARVAAYEVSK